MTSMQQQLSNAASPMSVTLVCTRSTRPNFLKELKAWQGTERSYQIKTTLLHTCHMLFSSLKTAAVVVGNQFDQVRGCARLTEGSNSTQSSINANGVHVCMVCTSAGRLQRVHGRRQ